MVGEDESSFSAPSRQALQEEKRCGTRRRGRRSITSVSSGTLALAFFYYFFLVMLGGYGSSLLVGADGDGNGFAFKDSSLPVEQRVDDLLSRMSLAEKIGQMTQIERTAADSTVVQNFFIGSLLSGGGSAPVPNASPSQWADMVDGFQNAALSTRLGIPLLYGIDAVHGHNNVYGATIFPHNIGLGATRDPDLVMRIGAATAVEVRATGIPYAFAPCIAVCRDPRWGRCYESYSEDTDLVRNLTQIIYGLQGMTPAGFQKGLPYVAPGGSNVVACAKHFVGDGGTFNGVDESNTLLGVEDLYSIHLAPYHDALEKGVSTIMISYSSWNGVKMSTNKFLITEVLKQHMGFQGFVISDWEALQRITSPPGSNFTYSVAAAVDAGIDMVMVPLDYTLFTTTLASLVTNGFISQERIDDAVRRILRVKFLAGLFEAPLADRSLVDKVGCSEHRLLAREAVRKSLVLMKNGKDGQSQMLPLDRNAPRILVAGSHADDLGYQCGGWTISWQGGSGESTTGTTILQGIKNMVSGSTEVVYEKYPDTNFLAGKEFSYAIVVVGEPAYTEMFGDNNNLTIPLNGIDTINNVCGGGAVKCLVVLVSGRPLVVEPYLSLMDAFVAAWLPGSEGQGVADVIFGDYEFTGKTPRTWFRSVEQLPMNLGDATHDPLFPYGFGMQMGV